MSSLGLLVTFVICAGWALLAGVVTFLTGNLVLGTALAIMALPVGWCAAEIGSRIGGRRVL